MTRTVSRLHRSSAPRWWPIYLLGLLAAALFFGDTLLPLPEAWRTFLLLPLTALICVLALWWGRRNEDLLFSEGIDAKVIDDPILRALLTQARGIEATGTVTERDDRP